MSRMLIAEAQTDLASALKDFFVLENYSVQMESNGLRTLESLRDGKFDVLALEVALPGVDGIGVVRSYRAAGGNAPIILMAGCHSSEELQSGLDAGADAYLVKPFRLLDLAAQVRALLRRPSLRSEKIMTSGFISLDSGAGTVTRNDILVHLHPMEFKLLRFLMSHPNQVFSAHALFERVWQKDFGLMEDTVRTHVRTLRSKIDEAEGVSFITTVRGMGYKTES